jgi:hypothetical protein
MKIYVYDRDWAGCIVVTAFTKEEALSIIKRVEGRGDHIKIESITEHELAGFIHENNGDCG